MRQVKQLLKTGLFVVSLALLAMRAFAQTTQFTDDNKLPVKTGHRFGPSFYHPVTIGSDGKPSAWYFADGLLCGFLADTFPNVYGCGNNTIVQGSNLANTTFGIINGSDGNQHFVPSYDGVLKGPPMLVPAFLGVTYAYSALNLGVQLDQKLHLGANLSDGALLALTYGASAAALSPTTKVDLQLSYRQPTVPYYLFAPNTLDPNFLNVAPTPFRGEYDNDQKIVVSIPQFNVALGENTSTLLTALIVMVAPNVHETVTQSSNNLRYPLDLQGGTFFDVLLLGGRQYHRTDLGAVAYNIGRNNCPEKLGHLIGIVDGTNDTVGVFESEYGNYLVAMRSSTGFHGPNGPVWPYHGLQEAGSCDPRTPAATNVSLSGWPNNSQWFLDIDTCTNSADANTCAANPASCEIENSTQECIVHDVSYAGNSAQYSDITAGYIQSAQDHIAFFLASCSPHDANANVACRGATGVGYTWFSVIKSALLPYGAISQVGWTSPPGQPTQPSLEVTLSGKLTQTQVNADATAIVNTKDPAGVKVSAGIQNGAWNLGTIICDQIQTGNGYVYMDADTHQLTVVPVGNAPALPASQDPSGQPGPGIIGVAVGDLSGTSTTDAPQTDFAPFGTYNTAFIYQNVRSTGTITFDGSGGITGTQTTMINHQQCVEGLIGTYTLPATDVQIGLDQVLYDAMLVFVLPQGNNCPSGRAGFLNVFFDGANTHDCDGGALGYCNENLEVSTPSEAYDKQYGTQLSTVAGSIILPDGD